MEKLLRHLIGKIGISVFLTFIGISGLSQPLNDECNNAIRLCPNEIISGTNAGATTNATSDHSGCYVPHNTVWYKFTSNEFGGNVTVHFTSLVIDPDPTKGQQIQAVIYSATAPCTDVGTYIPYAPCTNSAVDFDIATTIACVPNTTYFVQVNGIQAGVGVTAPAECAFDVSVSGPGIDASLPTVSLTVSETDFCQGEEVNVDVTLVDCGDTTRYDWYYDGVLLYSSTIDTFSTVTLSDTGDLVLIVFCDPICNFSDTTEAITLNVTAIGANAGPDKFIEAGEFVVIDGSGMGTPLWTPGASLTSGDSFTPTASPEETTTYFLTATNGNCTATDEVNVFVGTLIQVFTAFTPNDDAINDKWIIINSSEFPNMEVSVYDRSGQRVFNTTNYSSPDKWWDGTYKDKPLPASTYYYVIDLKAGNGKADIYKGMVNIIR